MIRSMISGALALFIISACGGEPQVAPVESPTSATENTRNSTTASEGASAGEFLPELAGDGTLPATLQGYTLLDPAPAESIHEAGFPFKGSVFHEDVLRKKPRASVRPYSLDGTIFRIVYQDDAPPAQDELMRAALETYGEPYQQKDNEIIWIRGGRTLTLSYFAKAGSASVAIEDEKSTLEALDLERS